MVDRFEHADVGEGVGLDRDEVGVAAGDDRADVAASHFLGGAAGRRLDRLHRRHAVFDHIAELARVEPVRIDAGVYPHRSEEHTSELQSLMRLSYAVFCLQKKKIYIHHRLQYYKTYELIFNTTITYTDFIH